MTKLETLTELLEVAETLEKEKTEAVKKAANKLDDIIFNLQFDLKNFYKNCKKNSNTFDLLKFKFAGLKNE